MSSINFFPIRGYIPLGHVQGVPLRKHPLERMAEIAVEEHKLKRDIEPTGIGMQGSSQKFVVEVAATSGAQAKKILDVF